MKTKALLPVLLMLSASFAGFFIVPAAHAVGNPIIPNLNSGSSPLSLSVTAGDTIVLNIFIRCQPCMTSGRGQAFEVVTSIIDAQGNHYTKQGVAQHVASSSQFDAWRTEFWTATASASGSDSITVVTNRVINQTFDNVNAFDGRNFPPNAIASANGSCAGGPFGGGCSAPANVVTSVSNAAGTVEFNGVSGSNDFDRCGLVSCSSSWMNFDIPTCAASGNGSSFSTPGTECTQMSYLQTGTTNYPFHCASCSNGYDTIGIVLGPAIVVTVITACTLFELQCWWYPLLFIGLYAGFILLVSTWLQASPRGKAHLFLSAVTMGSLVAVIFGIMSIAFPLLMLLLNSIIALRLRE